MQLWLLCRIRVEEMMKDPFLRDLGCFARHLRPYLDRFPAENFLVIQFEAIRRDLTAFGRKTYSFLNVAADFKPALAQQGKNAARAPRFPLLQSTAQKVYGGISALPGVGTLLKSPAVAKTLQDVYHRLNSKAQKYEALTPDARRKWEEYYADRSSGTFPSASESSGHRLTEHPMYLAAANE
jgi:hypothetical protein